MNKIIYFKVSNLGILTSHKMKSGFKKSININLIKFYCSECYKSDLVFFHGKRYALLDILNENLIKICDVHNDNTEYHIHFKKGEPCHHYHNYYEYHNDFIMNKIMGT